MQVAQEVLSGGASVIWDAIVLGGGPSGGVAALTLARGGARVLLLEKSKVPRFKLCSGVLSGHSKRLAGGILGDDLGGSVIGDTGTTRLSYASRGFTIQHRPLQFVDRAGFDAATLDRAAASGAVIRDECRAVSVTPSPGGGMLVAYSGPGGRRETATARSLIEARGSESPLARTLQVRQAIGLGVEARVPYAGPRECQLDWSMPGIGYFWLFPKSDGTAGVGGATVRTDLWPHLRSVVRRFWGERDIELPQDIPGHRMRFSLGPVARDGLYLVGEAAGAQDPVLGEGIRWALESGRLAGTAILSGGGERTYESTYQRNVRREIAMRRLPAAIGNALHLQRVWKTALRAPVTGGALVGHFLG